jgi:hypothetical protein
MGHHGLLRAYLSSFYMYMMFVLHRKHTYGPPRYVTGAAFLFLYVDDICTSQEIHLRPATACYRESFAFLWVDKVRTSQETYRRAAKACCLDGFTFTPSIDILLT